MKTVIFTVDIEPDWETSKTHAMETIVPKILEFFDTYDIRATFFVQASLAQEYEDELRDIAHKHEVGSHSFSHRNMTTLSKAEVMKELIASKEILEGLNIDVLGFRAPYNMIDPADVIGLKKAGYVYDSSLARAYFPGRYNNRDIPNKPYLCSVASLKEEGNYFLEIPITSHGSLKIPFGLSFLRAFHPFYPYDKIGQFAVFNMHPHEFLSGEVPEHAGWVVNKLSTRNKGQKAWSILQGMMLHMQCEGISCKDYIQRTHPHLLSKTKEIPAIE